MGIKATGQWQYLTIAQRTGLIPLLYSHKPALDLVAIWVKWSRKDTWIKSLSTWWSWSSIVTWRLSPWASVGSLLSLLTPGFCSQWPQTDLAADLPGTGRLKCDHTSGSPAFSLWKHEHDLLSPFFPTSQKYKESFLPSAPFSLTQRQAGKLDGWWFRIVIWERPLTAGKENVSSAHLTKYKPFKTCFSHNKWYVSKLTLPKNSNQKTHIEKQAYLLHPPQIPSEAATVTRLFCLPDHRHFSNPIFYQGFWIKRKESIFTKHLLNARP